VHRIFMEHRPPHAPPVFSCCPFACCDIKARDLSEGVVGLYPPSTADPWWLGGEAGQRAAQQMLRFGRAFCSAAGRLNSLFFEVIEDSSYASTDPAEIARGYIHRLPADHTPAVQDESRLFHRLLRLWIYYLRHVDPQLLPADMRPLVDVQSDEQG